MSNQMYYTGLFDILGEKISGNLIIDKSKGKIYINLSKRLDKTKPVGNYYGYIQVITGEINNGAIVTLCNNNCIHNNSRFCSSQEIFYSSEYLIWGDKTRINSKYNKLSCVVDNALLWSKLEIFEELNGGLRLKHEKDSVSLCMFDANISFWVNTNTFFFIPFKEEENTIKQKLVIDIEFENAQPLRNFIDTRNRLLTLISFATKNNINIQSQSAFDYQEYHLLDEKHRVFTEYEIIEATSPFPVYDINEQKFNFTLLQLKESSLDNNDFDKLIPVINLYLSLYRYTNMPVEMVFLNIIQAIETFHSRFFNNDKSSFLTEMKKKFAIRTPPSKMKDYILKSPQKHIILASRIYDLLYSGDIYTNSCCFYEFYSDTSTFVSTIVDTRNYYTHYDESKSHLMGDSLAEAINVLTILLECHINRIIGVDSYEATLNNLKAIRESKELLQYQINKEKDYNKV